MSRKLILGCAGLIASLMMTCAHAGYAGSGVNLITEPSQHAQGPPESIPLYALPGSDGYVNAEFTALRAAIARTHRPVPPADMTSTGRAAEGPRHLISQRPRETAAPLRVGWRS